MLHFSPPNEPPTDLALALVANELDLTEDDVQRTLVDLLARDAEIRYLVAQRLGNTDGCTDIEVSPKAPAS